MNVLMLTKNLDRPEAHLMRGLLKKGVKITLVLDKASPFQDVLSGQEITTYYRDFKSRFDLGAAAFIRRLVRSENFDIIHSFSARALSAALLGTISLPAKHVTYRGTSGHLSRLDPSSWLGYLNPKVSKIICVSDAVKRYLAAKNVNPSKLARIYKGHLPDWYKHYAPPSRGSIGFPEKSFLVACSANMRPVKGVDVLVKALEYLPRDADIKLVLIGEIRDGELRRLAASYEDRLIFTGFRPDATAIVSLCDLFCMPSREREGLPKALIEAMIQRVPVIATKVGGIPELIQDQKEGILVAANNPRAIAEAILKIYRQRELGKNFAEAAYQKVINDFSIERTVEETYQLYRELIFKN